MNEGISTTNIGKEVSPEGEGLSVENKRLLDENKELTASNIELRKKLEIFKKLTGTIAHDVRNQLNVIGGLAECALDELGDLNISSNENDSKERVIKYIKSVNESNGKALALFNNLLLWSRSQIDGVKIEFYALDLRSQITEVGNSLSSMMENKKINFKKEIPNDLEVLADSTMFQTVIRNLISNAVKFTNIGGNITVFCREENGLVRIDIIDDGVGLAKDTKDSLFNSVGTSNRGTNNEEGTGLGLSICKEMVEKMGGTISVSSEGEGKGTTFSVTLPEAKKV